MFRAAVIGATGYAGADLVRILAGHPDVELSMITSRQYGGQPFSKVYPSMAGMVDMECAVYDAKEVCDAADIIFTALPHKVSMSIIPELIDNGKRVIDLSADFRFNDADLYESCYQPHMAKDLLEKSVYGLSEIYTEQIKNAQLIGNPGCYPTSVLLPLIPLLKEGLVDIKSIIADSKSGVSGAGRSTSLATHFCEVNESFKAYKVADHRHNPEMNMVLSREAGKDITITFVPHLVPMIRGMLTTSYSTLEKPVDEVSVRNILKKFYKGRYFVRICDEGTMPDTRNVRGANFCDIGVKIDETNNRMILVSAIDNVVKGAAGQSVQNMNIMLGLDEKAGLNNVPYPV
ncbi:MAG: N-acetyl-gamma-glutamyl-phosphate reductase [Desulfobacterales bacterium]|nr:N-acetyl-gamma-glutamyl-phosphate reductase [Desulfobacterales bacterium]